METRPSDRSLPPDSVDDRIVGSLERLSQAFRTLLREKAKENPLGLTLSPIQIQVLSYLRQRETSRIGELALEFDLAAATMSEVVRVLREKQLVARERSAEDGRIQVLRLTPRGREAAGEVADWSGIVAHHLRGHSDAEKVIVMRFLLDLIESMHRAGLISVTRMCATCRYFGRDESDDPTAPHYCHLMETPLRGEDLRVDCPEHEPAD